MAKLPIRRDTAALLATALTAAGVVGAAWVLDAMRRDEEARRLHRTLVELLLNALTADDPVTARHSIRVADLSFALAEACGMDTDEKATLRVAALLHDMGKIDDRFFHIVHSRKPLSEEQRAQMKHHPHQSAHILKPLEAQHPGIMEIVASHHECWNGCGYPRGLSGHDIPLSARIIALADAFDAITQPRKYKDAVSIEEALEKLDEGAGRQFDPQLVRLVESDAVLAQWQQIASEGQEEEREHLAHPSPTEAALERVNVG